MKKQNLNFVLVMTLVLVIGGMVSALNTYISNTQSTFNGSVGIGTSNPFSLLTVGGDSRGHIEIVGTSIASPFLTLNHTPYTNGRAYSIYSGGSAAGNFDIYDATANAARLSIDSAGKVGIGTSSPAQLLHLYNSSTNVSVMAETGTEGFGSFFISKSPNRTFLAGLAGDLGDDWIVYDATNATVRIDVDGDTGNVGIGTTNPSNVLHVAGDTVGPSDSNGQLRLSGSSNDNKRLLLGVDTNEPTMYGYIQAVESGSGYKNLALNQNGGNVGVGTNAPSNKLHVAGDAGAPGDRYGQLRISGSDANKALLLGVDTTASPMYSYLQSVRSGWDYEDLILNQQGGNVGVGTTTPSTKFHVSDLGSSYPLTVTDSSNTCSFGVSGSGWTISCTSDKRLKTDIKDTEKGLDWLMNFRVRDYVWKSDGSKGTGFIAQEVQEFAPEMVNLKDDGYLTISNIPEPTLVKAIQELKTENDDLKSEVELLKQRLDQFEANNLCYAPL